MAIVAISGCDTLPPPVDDDRTTEQQIADGLALFGVDATRVFAGASALVNAILAANQVLLGRDRKRLGKIVAAIDEHPNTPKILDMLSAAAETHGMTRTEYQKSVKLLSKMIAKG